MISQHGRHIRYTHFSFQISMKYASNYLLAKFYGKLLFHCHLIVMS